MTPPHTHTHLEQVAGVGVAVEEPNLQQLGEEGSLPDLDQRLDLQQ